MKQVTQAFYQSRLEQLKVSLARDSAALYSHPSEVEYLTGIQTLLPLEREAMVLVTPDQTYLFLASFTPTPKIKNLMVLTGCRSHHLASHWESITNRHPILKKISVDYSNLTVGELRTLELMKNITVSALDPQVLSSARAIKSTPEIDSIKKAAKIAKTVMTKAFDALKVDLTEQDLAKKIQIWLIELNSERPAFPPIVAFGPHTALPHHQPTLTRLKPEAPVLIDLGATFHSYCSDMTRTKWFGEHPDKKFGSIERSVKNAFAASLHQLYQGSVLAKDLDAAARDHITRDGFGSAFIHTTGHGVGLDVHEFPSLQSGNQTLIQPGMIITIEPGIYLKGKFGYRHEDTIHVRDNGFENLTEGL